MNLYAIGDWQTQPGIVQYLNLLAHFDVRQVTLMEFGASLLLTTLSVRVYDSICVVTSFWFLIHFRTKICGHTWGAEIPVIHWVRDLFPTFI